MANKLNAKEYFIQIQASTGKFSHNRKNNHKGLNTLGA